MDTTSIGEVPVRLDSQLLGPIERRFVLNGEVEAFPVSLTA